MEIIVEGKGKKYLTPDETILNFTFKIICKSYKEALDQGLKNVNSFIDDIIIPNGFKPSDMKTRSFTIIEEKRYDDDTKDYVFEGYSFNQHARLKLDYDKDKLLNIMTSISELLNPPIYHIDFSIKDKKTCRKNLLKDAYEDAKEQASTIAFAAGKSLGECIKVDFKPITTNYSSNTDFASIKEYGMCSSKIINQTFTPEDIELHETLYCIWNAE